jgi:hypothetical protein
VEEKMFSLLKRAKVQLFKIDQQQQQKVAASMPVSVVLWMGCTKSMQVPPWTLQHCKEPSEPVSSLYPEFVFFPQPHTSLCYSPVPTCLHFPALDLVYSPTSQAL